MCTMGKDLQRVLGDVSRVKGTRRLHPKPTFPIAASLGARAYQSKRPTRGHSFGFSNVTTIFGGEDFHTVYGLRPRGQERDPSSYVLGTSKGFHLSRPHSIIPFPVDIRAITRPTFRTIVDRSPDGVNFRHPRKALSKTRCPPPVGTSR